MKVIVHSFGNHENQCGTETKNDFQQMGAIICDITFRITLRSVKPEAVRIIRQGKKDMKIKTRLRLNTWISLVVVMLMMLSLAWSFWEIDRADRNENLVRGNAESGL